MKKSLTKYLPIVILLFVFSECARVPITGRKQFSLVSNEEIIPLVEEQYDSIIQAGPLSKDMEQTALVRNVGTKIQLAVESFMAEKKYSDQLDGFEWEYNLIAQDIVNAWCMPGGKVAFYTGIMPICATETGVAVVMGHEIAHAIAHHGRERMSNALVAQFGIGVVSVALGENPGLTKQIFLQSIGIGTQLGMLSFSRKHESEADKIGLMFMAMAGYDPREAVDFWKRMNEMSGGGQPPEWLSTHPSHETRISDLEGWIPEAMKYYEATL